MSSIRVAVRVRPLNEAEISRNCALVVKAEDSQVIVTNPESERSKTFKFDDVFCSCDTEDEHFQSQKQVCSVLGDYVLSAAFEGYNTCVFSYGQSGTGKTFAMLGNDDVQGLIEYVNEHLFNRAASSDPDTSFRAEISFLEIYNECVNDLLERHNQVNVLTRSSSLKVHDDPERGTYVEKLSTQIVTNIDETKKIIEKGMKNRIALQSSDGLTRRSHTIFILQFTQAKMVDGAPSEKVSTLSFVDLAGTDRRHARDDRTIIPDEDNEAAIARSLQTFGQVISSLASRSNDKQPDGESAEQESIEVPYKESALTLLLKDCLGGNCKTVMLATVSPADIHYNKTISTLRYANHTKNIMNKPSVNEEANVKLIKDLQGEIEELKLKMKQEGISLKSEEKIKENERLVKRLTGIWEEKWLKTKEIIKDRALEVTALGQGLKFETDQPHFITLGGGRLSVGVTMCPLKEGKTIIGLPTSDSKPDIALSGKGIEREHCTVEYDGETVMFFPNAPLCSIDGVPITEPTKLPQGCMVCLGKSNYFRFNHPKEAKRIRERNPGNRFSVMPDKYYPEVELAIEQRKREQQERDRLKEENARLLAREKQHKEVLGRLEYEKKQLMDESNRLRNLERLQREEAEKFKTRITAKIQELEQQRDELKNTAKEEEKLSILGVYESQLDGASSPNANGQYFEDEEEKLNKIQVLQAERVKLLEKDLEEQIVKLHETRDLELAKINAERERIKELEKQQKNALEQVEMERMRLKDERKNEIRVLEEERAKLENLEKERLEIIEKAFQEREQGKQEIEAEKQHLVDLQNKYNEQLSDLEESMLSTQEKMEKERQLEFEFFETEQLMLEELELKQREAAEQMERERKLIEAHYECERQEEKRKLEMEKLKLEEVKREHTSALRNVEEERKKLQLDRQRQQEQMVRDKVRLTNIEKKYKELLSRAEEEKQVLRVQLEKEKEEEMEKFRQEMLQTMSSRSSLGRQSPTGSVDSSKRTNSSDDVVSTGKKSTEGLEADELEAEREKLRQEFERVRDQEERLIIKEREMAALNEKGLDYEQKIEKLEKTLNEERKKREDSEKELQEKEQIMGNGRPTSSATVGGTSSGDDLDLVRHLLSTGHVLDNCPSVNVTQSCCRGYLDKRGGKIKSSWKKRWFVFDRRMKALVYYKDQSKKEPRAIIYFQAIQEVYVDHESEAKNNSVRSSFCVKTPLKTYTLAADNALAMAVWIDVLLTGREGTAIIKN